MDVSSPPSPRFIFRGNSMASGGYLTRLDGKPVALSSDHVTVHGESSLPGAGGISHSVIDKPVLWFAPWVTYGRCETRVEGITNADGSKTTTVYSTVCDVSVKTRPSPEDRVDFREIAIEASEISVAVKSVHPREGQPQFFLAQTPVTNGLRLRLAGKEGPDREAPFELMFDHPLVDGYTMDRFEHEFEKDRRFFDRYSPGCRGPAPRFGGKPPRNSSGYLVCSIVHGFKLAGKYYPGNQFAQPGFGRVTFGTMLADGSSRRITMVETQFGSDPAGASSHGGVDTNGVWGP